MDIRNLVIVSSVLNMFIGDPRLSALPTAFRLAANATPILLEQNATFPPVLTEKERTKLDSIKKMVEEIEADIGTKMKPRINVTSEDIENAYCIGNSYSFTGPVVAIGKRYFDHYQKPSVVNSEGYQSWKHAESMLSTDPITMAKQLDQLNPQNRADYFACAKKYESYLSKEELSAILAHELGHAKNNHLIRSMGFTQLLVTGLPLLSRFVDPKSISFTSVLAAYTLVRYAVSYHSRSHENEADKELQNAQKYAQGGNAFFRRSLMAKHLSKLEPHQSCEEKVEKMLSSRDLTLSHPNPAKRMLNMHQMIQAPKKIDQRYSISSWLMVAAGVVGLSIDVFATSSTLAKYYKWI